MQRVITFRLIEIIHVSMCVFVEKTYARFKENIAMCTQIQEQIR